MEKALLNACHQFYGKRLISLAIYGSVGRGDFSIGSDLDVLIIAEPLPDGRGARVQEFLQIEEALEELMERTWAAGWTLEFSPIMKTRAEADLGSPLFLDMTEDARLLYDRDDYFAQRLERLRENLRRLGSKRIWNHDTWYWDLKPDWKKGDVIEL